MANYFGCKKKSAGTVIMHVVMEAVKTKWGEKKKVEDRVAKGRKK